MALSRAVSNSGRSSSRYRYFSTPVIRLFSPSQYDHRNYGQAALQRVRPENDWTRQSGAIHLSLPNDVNHTFHIETDAPAFDPTTLPSSEWTPERVTDIQHEDLPPLASSSLAKKRMARPKRHDQRGVSMKSLAEEPWFQDEEPETSPVPRLLQPVAIQTHGRPTTTITPRLQDVVPTNAAGPSSIQIDATRFDWRTTATSQLPVYKREEQLLNRKPFRYKIKPSEGEAQSSYNEEIDSYSNQFAPLIRKEQLASDAVLEDRVNNWSMEKLEEEGFCITGLSGFWQEATHFGRPVAVFSLGPGTKFEWHRLEAGDQVRLSAVGDGPLHDDHITGAVVRISETELRIAFEERFKLYEDVWRMDLWTSDVAAQRMIDAINSFRFNPADQVALHVEKSVPRQSILCGTELRDVLLHGFRPTKEEPAPQPTETFDAPGAFEDNQLIASWVRRHRSPDPFAMPGDPEITLNQSQVNALALMIGSRISLVQGPPGTGKTRTIATAVKLLKSHFKVPHPTLVCTYTNVAVDNLVENLVSEGLNPLRVGSVGKIKESVAPYSLEARMEAHKLAPELKEVQLKLIDLGNTKKKLSKLKDVTAGEAALKKVMVRLERVINDEAKKEKVKYRLRMKMLTDIVHSADVICTTCITAASSALNVIDFPVVFLDEASMCTEPASLIPIMKGCKHLALIGDHKQLPPIITSPEALSGGLGVSLFERLISEGGVPTVMLDRQYRMHPQISAFPAQEFYAGTLRDGVFDDPTGQAVKGLVPALKSSHLVNPDNSSVVFLNHTGAESRKDKSRVNEREADIVCNIVEDVLKQNPELTGNSIGIIAPYAAQITLLGKLLRDNSAFQSRLTVSLGQYRALETSAIEVKTVDGFEGREKDVIIFSTVRNNAAGYIGFLADRRRLNVGLTRAKRALFVVGNARTLKAGKVGYVEGAGLAAAGSGAGAKNVKVDVGVDVAGQAAKDLTLVAATHKAKQEKDEVWKRYLGWLDERGLVVNIGAPKLSPKNPAE